ncbi:MAG: type 2 isopentenyl-diphosphate Delta-isomerase [Bacteroidota bacterium]|nr:type 2 isopentenyl-diphosphate Delta-isomerase [Bacteroidota bacterium]
MKKRKITDTGNNLTTSRKQSHVELVVSEQVSFRQTSSGFDRIRFVHNALPEIALSDVETSTDFLGKHLDVPILISSMTGGYEAAERINRALGALSAKFGAAMGVGSQRQALEDKRFHNSFKVARKANPSGLIFSNIGAVEVARLAGKGKTASIKRIIDLVEADALIIHLNPLQELLQPEGSSNFTGVLNGIGKCVKSVGVPVIVKEVGAGISKDVAKQLLEVGVLVIDVAGAGGTSWAGVEILRQKKKLRSVLEPFWDWGIPTVDALLQVRELRESMTFGIISSGGIRNGLDIAKSIALGADLVGIAKPLVSTFMEGGEKSLNKKMEDLITQLKYCMFLTGSKNVEALSKQPLQKF